jgi:hypothetical protein
MFYANHRPFPWLTEDATPRSLEPLVRGLRDAKIVARRNINRHAKGANNETTKIIKGGKIEPPYLSASIVAAHESPAGNRQSDTFKNTTMRHTRTFERVNLGSQVRTIAVATINQAAAVSKNARGKARPITVL